MQKKVFFVVAVMAVFAVSAVQSQDEKLDERQTRVNYFNHHQHKKLEEKHHKEPVEKTLDEALVSFMKILLLAGEKTLAKHLEKDDDEESDSLEQKDSHPSKHHREHPQYQPKEDTVEMLEKLMNYPEFNEQPEESPRLEGLTSILDVMRAKPTNRGRRRRV